MENDTINNHEKTHKKHYDKPQMTIDELSSALYTSNEQLKQRNKELLEAQQSRNEMFANISHDLRSPITAIRSSIEYLTSLDHISEEDLQTTFKLLTTRIVSLESLINDIFLLTGLDNNAFQFEYETVNIGVILEEYYFSCEADNKFDERRLELVVPEQFAYFVHIDTKRFIRVLDNLFTNALKYSRVGDAISLGASKEDKEVLIWVKDSGIGIEPRLCDKIFERSYKVAAARTPKEASGAGLGLSIARTIMDKMEGRIWCESDLGRGSTFYMTLPVFNE